MTATSPPSFESGPYDVTLRADVPMTTRDGKTLWSDIYQSVGGESHFPTLVRRTPYGKHLNDLALEFNEAHYFASHGYLTVVQNTRGRYGSEGIWYPFAYEGQDGYDTVEWAAALPESNGRVGTFGQSYGAIAQYLAAAQRPPHLVTAIPVSAYLLAFENYWYNNGAFELGWALSYFTNMAEDALRSEGDFERLEELNQLKADPTARFGPLRDSAIRHLPLTDWIERFGSGASFLRDVLHHSQDDVFWWANDMRRQLHNIDIPMLHVGSWYDIANPDTPQYYSGIRQQAISQQARQDQALFMGPWAHLLPFSQPTSGGTGDIDWGPDAAYPMLEMQRRWFDHFLRDGRTGLPQSPVRIFVTGRNTWRNEEQWPIERARATELYLRSTGSAATSAEDGALVAAITDADPSGVDEYVYDPDDPVPTSGGRYVGGGVRDQRSKQAREDVLVYTGPILGEEVEVTGAVSVRLHVSTDGPDTDFVVVLCDVRPDGFVQNLAEGLCRLRFRTAFDEPEAVEPGAVHEIDLSLGNIAHAFARGHRIRLLVTSSDFPRWDRNPNTGEDATTAREFRRATQRVYHGPRHRSMVRLPVVGGPEGDDPPTATEVG